MCSIFFVTASAKYAETVKSKDDISIYLSLDLDFIEQFVAVRNELFLKNWHTLAVPCFVKKKGRKH
jgi:hypothetical protein